MDSVEGFDNGAVAGGIQLSRRKAPSGCRTPHGINAAAFSGYSGYRPVRAAIGEGGGCRTGSANVRTGGFVVGALRPRLEGFLGTHIVDRGCRRAYLKNGWAWL